MKKLLMLLSFVLLVENAILFYPHIFSFTLQKEQSRVVRGWKKAESLGCFSCHGPRGFGETPNPGSEDGEVPSFRGGEPMMWAKNDQELREFILYGEPKKKHEHEKHRESKEKKKQKETEPHVFGDVDFDALPEDEEEKEGLIEMPSFKKWVSAEDVEDLVIFIKANATLLNPKTKHEKEGRNIMLETGCFSCHGPMGAGGIPNSGSFKGYIPSFIGDDYDELVKNEDELVEWIKTGKIKRFEKNILARFFTHRQVIKMPSYEKTLTNEQINKVTAYLSWLREEGELFR